MLAFLKEHIPENESLSAEHMLKSKQIDFYSLPTHATLIPYDDQLIEPTKEVYPSSWVFVWTADCAFKAF